ncbi:MAG: ThuA protein, partial [Verrucomicrobiales bacterium]|nr:ThuA protein [Verrucomicrobiales bacterium]
HPITAGSKDFKMHDEIYKRFRVRPGVTPLLTTDHPESGKPLMWARNQGKSRLVYLQLGHDQSAYNDPNYRTLVSRSIKWVTPGNTSK